MDKTEFIIRDNGTITQRTISERDLNAEDDVMDALTSEVTRRIKNVLQIPDWGTAHASVGLTDTIWSIHINRIPLKARFKVINGVLLPMFASTTDLEMPLVWNAPESVKLAFVVQTELSEGVVSVAGNWLFALNHENNGFRLPLPNLHDDCRICMGEFDSYHETAQECLVASLNQFNKSKWNSDLMRTIAESQKFFRFKPTNETFETLPMEADWTTLCEKVSTAILDRVVP